MKYGPVLTYKDIEEAEKLIGKKVIGSDYFEIVEIKPEKCTVATLTGISENRGYGNFDLNDCDNFQFIREVIEEPTYRPFNSVEELVEHWEKNYGGNNRPKGTMPLIWVKDKIDRIHLIADYDIECNSVFVINGWVEPLELFEKLTFLDGKPIGVKE